MPMIEFAQDQTVGRLVATDRPHGITGRTAAWTAVLVLAVMGIAMRVGGMAMLHRIVRNCPILGPASQERQPAIIRTWTAALDQAHTLYLSRTWCLQRAATLACLLRLSGVEGTVVIGVQTMPFYAHAWVEVNGAVVNDEPSLPIEYRVISRW